MSESKPTLTKQLLEAIQQSGMSINAIAKGSGVSQSTLQRFTSGERDKIRLDTASRLADYFGMRLTAPKKPKGITM